MKKLFVFAKRSEKKEAEKIISEFKKFDCVLYTDVDDIKGTVFVAEPKSIISDVDCLVVLGGDGSLLGVAREYAMFDKPILGINFGRLGYLVELEKNDTDALKKLFNDEFSIEERTMINATVYRQENAVFNGTALNDAVITKGALSRMIHLKLEVSGLLANQYHADGVVIATPTGSTAYSMSAGGSVVTPELEAFLITPICPHSVTSKPIIVSDKQKIRIEADFVAEEEVYLTLDGQEVLRLQKGDYVEIKKSDSITKLIRIKERNFFSILKQKLENR